MATHKPAITSRQYMSTIPILGLFEMSNAAE